MFEKLFKPRKPVQMTEHARKSLGLAAPSNSDAQTVIAEALAHTPEVSTIYDPLSIDPLSFETIGETAVGPGRMMIKADHKYKIETHLETTAKMVAGLNARAEALRLEQEADIAAWQEGNAARSEAAKIAADELEKATARRAEERAEIDRLLNFYSRAPELMAVAAPVAPELASNVSPAVGSHIQIDGVIVEVCGNRASNARRAIYAGHKIFVRNLPCNFNN